MDSLIEAANGKTHDLLIRDDLLKLLLQAAFLASVYIVRVTSGGQRSEGTCLKRKG